MSAGVENANDEAIHAVKRRKEALGRIEVKKEIMKRTSKPLQGSAWSDFKQIFETASKPQKDNHTENGDLLPGSSEHVYYTDDEAAEAQRKAEAAAAAAASATHGEEDMVSSGSSGTPSFEKAYCLDCTPG
jgi:hypothetical protein